jgi:Zn-dependent oligopeptidase
MDLALHSAGSADAVPDPARAAEEYFGGVFLAPPDGTAFLAYVGHMAGYDGAYYGYAWADAIAADLATVFQRAPGRYLDAEAGRRLRDEIYAPGNSRKVEDSIRRFLGRERSLEPFFESLGIKDAVPASE